VFPNTDFARNPRDSPNRKTIAKSLETPCFKPFSRTYLSTLDINTILSTWGGVVPSAIFLFNIYAFITFNRIVRLSNVTICTVLLYFQGKIYFHVLLNQVQLVSPLLQDPLTNHKTDCLPQP